MSTHPAQLPSFPPPPAPPTLYTPRLRLRSFTPADAPRIQELAGDPRIAATTASIPHPYPEGAAPTFVNFALQSNAQAKGLTLAITLAGTRSPGRENDPTDTGHLIGTISLALIPQHRRAILGYWIGTPYWNKGFATEAGHAILACAFTRLTLHRVAADHFAGNPASGRVLQKLGLTREGLARQAFFKNGQFQDVVHYGILFPEWQKLQRTPRPPLAVRPALQPA